METGNDTLRAYCTLDRIDHADTHLVVADRADRMTPESWAREILEGPPAVTRARLTAVAFCTQAVAPSAGMGTR